MTATPAAAPASLPAAGRTDAFTIELPEGPCLRGLHCDDCGVTSWPPARFCPSCSSSKVEVFSLGNRGTLHTWTTLYQDPGPSFIGDRPYTIVTVDLPAGVRVTSTLAGPAPAGGLHRGLPLEIEVLEITSADGEAPVYDFRFRPAGE